MLVLSEEKLSSPVVRAGTVFIHLDGMQAFWAVENMTHVAQLKPRLKKRIYGYLSKCSVHESFAAVFVMDCNFRYSWHNLMAEAFASASRHAFASRCMVVESTT